MAQAQSSTQSPHLTIDEAGIAEVRFDDPDRSANVLRADVLASLGKILGRLHEGAREGRVHGVLVTSGKSGSFIVGADVEAIGKIDSPDEGVEAARAGQRLYLELERLPVPTVAAIHGTCLGGGTELALACRYRLASDHPSTRIGLPEVQLGILPAWGGTTRLPRLIGLRAALDLLLTGKQVDARKAKRIGLVEAVFPHAAFPDHAREFLRRRIQDGRVPTGARRGLGARLIEDTAPGRRVAIGIAARKVKERTGDRYPAPLRILDVVRASMGRSVEDALEIEARAAGELLASPVSKNLLHVFHLREAARKGTGVTGSVKPGEIGAIGIVGAGVMGGGIAQLAAAKEIRVRLKDVRHEAVGLALRHADQRFRESVSRRRLSRREAAQAMDRISGGVDYAGFRELDLVVEAVVEKLDVKRTVLAEVEGRVTSSCILATNTSSLSVTEMAEALDKPERFLGMHFFNPVHRMPLVEVVRGERTSDMAVATVYALALRLGKVPVVVGDGPGFLVNRILGPYLNEAGHLLQDGVSVQEVDRVALEFGMPMGPLRLIDEIGVDVMGHAGAVLHAAFGDRLAPSRTLTVLGESGRTGKKGGAGFYRHEEGKEAEVDPEIPGLLGLGGRREGGGPSPEEIRDRLVLSMVNEAARILEDGIAESAADVDLAMIMGTGFPPFRGGLLRLADESHPRSLVERIERYQGELGSRFEPAPLLARLAREDRGFYDAFPADGE